MKCKFLLFLCIYPDFLYTKKLFFVFVFVFLLMPPRSLVVLWMNKSRGTVLLMGTVLT